MSSRLSLPTDGLRIAGRQFELAVGAACLLATRRGRLQDYFATVAALGRNTAAACGTRRAELLAQLRKLAAGQYLEAPPDERFAGPHPGKYLAGYASTLEPNGDGP